MRPEEAKLVAALIARVGLPRGSTCLNIGSSTRVFRDTEQPHIHESLINPIEAAGIRVIHCDIKAEAGVDLVGDVLDARFQAILSKQKPSIILCCNLLEHLEDPQRFSTACGNLLEPGGYAVVSVPLSYPYHPDPIDTLLRLTPDGIAAFFPGFELIHGDVVISQTFLQETMRKPRGIVQLIRHVGRVTVPFYRPRYWPQSAHRLMWLWRPYKVSVALLRKSRTT